MKLFREIDLLGDKKLVLKLNIFSLLLFVVFCLFFTVLGTPFAKNVENQEMNFWQFSLVILFFFLLIVIHEGIHGIFFKLFSKEGKVKFGFKKGFAYATSPGSYYSKFQFIVICLAPFVVINSAIFVTFLLGKLAFYSYIILSSMHAGGCVGDFYWTYLTLRAPENAIMEDTEDGIRIWEKN